MPQPAVFGTPPGALGQFTEQAQALTDSLNPFNNLTPGQVPFYNTGARAFIRIGGKPIGVAQNFNWTITYQPELLQTVDTNIPWDVSAGPLTINAFLSRIIDPTSSPEFDSLLMGTMSSSVHAPLVELQVLDKLGTTVFFARGVFNSVSGSIARGQLSTYSAQFIGIAYQNYVGQNFKPYSGIASGLSGLVNSLGGLASDLGI